MDPAEEEGSTTGRLKPGQRTVAGVVTQDVYDALLALQEQRTIPTISKTVGEALREWRRVRAENGFKPDRARQVPEGTSEEGAGLKPSDAREVTLQPWQEIRGLVSEVAEEGQHIRVSLEDGTGVVVVRLPLDPRGPQVEAGSRVAILRTDEPAREYVVRALD